MKSQIQFRNLALAGILVMGTLLSGCKDMFKDPMIDKETGEDVTLLLMDMNFIKTKINVQVQDMTTGLPIENEELLISFYGEDAENLVNFEGYKNTDYTTSAGLVEVGYDPGIPVNSQDPIELTVMVESENYISAPQFVSYTSEGVKDLVLEMIPLNELKSAKLGAYGEPFDLNFNGQPKSPQLVFVTDFSLFKTGTDYKYINNYKTSASGPLVCNNLIDTQLYADYGVYITSKTPASNLMPPALPTKSKALVSGDKVFSAVKKSAMLKCTDVLKLKVTHARGAIGTGIFNYKINFSDASTKTGRISCTFPSTNVIEQLYYPASNPAVKVELIGDAQYDISPAVNLNSPCGATASFVATPKTNLMNYKLITRYSCPKSTLGMSLSMTGEFRKKSSTGLWTSFKFIEGIADLVMVPGVDYEYRVNLKGVYYYFTLPNSPEKVQSFLANNVSPDFIFRNLTVTSTPNLVTINADVQFSANVCDVMK